MSPLLGVANVAYEPGFCVVEQVCPTVKNWSRES